MTDPAENPIKTAPITKVEISFFKPTGFEDTHYVLTEDRGEAARVVMGLYAAELKMLNYIVTSLFDMRRLPANAKLVSVPVNEMVTHRVMGRVKKN